MRDRERGKERKQKKTESKEKGKQKEIFLQFDLSLNCRGCWEITDDFTSFLQFSLFLTALLDLVNSRPVHSLMLSSDLFFYLPCLLLPFTVPCKMIWGRLETVS